MNLKRLVSSLLIILLVFSSLGMASAQTVSNKMLDSKVKQERKLVKKLKKSGQDEKLDPNEEVRVIVELEDGSALFSAQSSGKNYKDLSESTKKKLRNDALDTQNKVKSDIKKKAVPMKYKESFTTVVNGFSGDVPYKSVKVLEDLPNVKNVYVANKYERPTEEPEMLYSKELVKAQQTWQDYGYKGEGMTVAVIDTGIDPSHRDMILSDETTPELSKEAVDQITKEKGLPGKYYTEKVPYAYNYADRNNQILDLGPDASMHGMHVAGTVGANGDEENGGIKGVAPEAQILGMKVFGNDPEMPSTWGDIYIKAIDDAIILGADVINMSLGSTAGYVSPDDPEQKAVARAVENGVMMAISAGNSARFGEGHDNPFASNPDIGLVGSPGIAGESLQVASFENQYLDLEGFNVMIDGEEGDVFSFVSSGNVEPTSLGDEYIEVVDAGLGRMPGDSTESPDANDFEGIDLDGKIALIKRGESPFVSKALNAQAQGAVGVIIYNNASGYVNMVNDPEIKIPYIFTLKEYGDQLQTALNDGKEVKIAFKGNKVKALNPENNKLSEFTSWGVTPNLDFKPEITAPGGNILSTLNGDQYGLMSGTSMAAPHVAGGSALVLQRIEDDFQLTGANRVMMAKNILMNTSRPQTDMGLYNNYYKTGLKYSPRRQGTGLMDLHAAMATPVVVTEATSGISKVALKEMKDKESFTLKLTNHSDDSVVYKTNGTVQTDLVLDNYNMVETQGIFKEGTLDESGMGEFPIKITSVNGSDVNGEYHVLVPANKTVEVKVELDLTNTIDWASNVPLEEIFENGYFVEGFVSFTDVNDTHPELTVPYVGFKGDWDQAPIVDQTIYEENSFYGMSGLISEDYEFLGTNPVSEEAFGDKVAFSPNSDGNKDTVIPALSFLRNAKNVKFSVENENNEKIQTIRTENEVLKHYYDGGSGEMFTAFDQAAWDGKSKGKVLPDGLYHYVVESVIDFPGAEWQKKEIPVYIDTKKPTVEATIDNETGVISWTSKDQGVGVSHIDILVNGQSVLETPLAADQTEYTLEKGKEAKHIKVVAYDWAGNVGSDSIGEDDTIPFITVYSPEALGVNSERVVQVEGFINDDSDVKKLFINGKEVPLTWNSYENNYMFSKEIEFKSDGVHDLEFKGVDSKGNEISFLRKVIIDSEKPSMKVNGPHFTNESKVDLSFELEDNFSEMRFYMDDSEEFYHQFKEPYVMETYKKTINKEVTLKDGANHFEFRLVDLAGHTTIKNITIYKTTKQAKQFKDVYSGFWAKEEIETLNVQGVINGYDNGKFGVADNIKRIQAAQMIVRALNLDTANRPNPNLKDVQPGSYGYDVIATVADEGIMTGNNGVFNTQGTLTRAQMAKILVEAYNLTGTTNQTFKDVTTGYWASGYINTLAANGITTGYDNNTFKPQDNLTRSQFAVFLARIQDDRFK
ncbi:S8 family serine peptidase [Rossellomorea sp. KS-H15a]|uniref:S8 family serine peptidase n=1 Tax=Rossellomorea sp. KS-H15a TaxID=2963940 RepID=UPI0020C6386E|nr:S8 family serine peptidase [Rossellomorea sp. KS-H15a]UTE77352.1 S8 family serine peptidase [Rossellomorea sp. KS-H15a]